MKAVATYKARPSALGIMAAMLAVVKIFHQQTANTVLLGELGWTVGSGPLAEG